MGEPRPRAGEPWTWELEIIDDRGSFLFAAVRRCESCDAKIRVVRAADTSTAADVRREADAGMTKHWKTCVRRPEKPDEVPAVEAAHTEAAS